MEEKDKGVDTIAIVSVNDAFVMNAWKRDTDQRDGQALGAVGVSGDLGDNDEACAITGIIAAGFHPDGQSAV